jgi:hypothetical protein
MTNKRGQRRTKKPELRPWLTITIGVWLLVPLLHWNIRAILPSVDASCYHGISGGTTSTGSESSSSSSSSSGGSMALKFSEDEREERMLQALERIAGIFSTTASDDRDDNDEANVGEEHASETATSTITGRNSSRRNPSSFSVNQKHPNMAGIADLYQQQQPLEGPGLEAAATVGPRFQEQQSMAVSCTTVSGVSRLKNTTASQPPATSTGSVFQDRSRSDQKAKVQLHGL